MTRKLSILKTLALTGLVAGSTGFTDCDKKSDTTTGPATGTSAKVTEAEFTADCAALNGMLEQIATCNGHATCAGKSLSEGVVKTHDCAGKNDCAGLNCKVPAAG